MRTDYLGNPVSTNADAALAAIDNFVDGFLGYEARAAEVIGAAEVHPDEVLLNAYAATLWLLLEAPEAAERAAPHLARTSSTTVADRLHACAGSVYECTRVCAAVPLACLTETSMVNTASHTLVASARLAHKAARRSAARQGPAS